MSQSLDDLYTKYQQPSQPASMDDLYGKYSGGTSSGYKLPDVPLADITPVDKTQRLENIGKGVADFVADPFRELGSAARNVVSSPENDTRSYQNFSGENIDVPGYIQGQEASPVDTAKQAAGAGVGAAATVLPFLKGAKALELLKASPILTGAGEGYAQDVSQHTKEGNLGPSALLPGLNTAIGGGLGVLGKGAQVVATPVEDLRSNALIDGIEGMKNRTNTVRKSFEANTIDRPAPTPENPTATVKVTPDAVWREAGTPGIKVDTTGGTASANTTPIIDHMNDSIGNLEDSMSKSFQEQGVKIDVSNIKSIAQQVVDNATNVDGIANGKVTRAQVAEQLQERLSNLVQEHGTKWDGDSLRSVLRGANKDFKEESRDVSRLLGDTLRKVIYEQTDQGKTILNKIAEYIRARDFAVDLNGKKVAGGGSGRILGHLSGTGIGGAIGSTFGPVGTAVGAFIGDNIGTNISKVIQKMTFMSPTAEIKQGVIDVLKKIGLKSEDISTAVEAAKQAGPEATAADMAATPAAQASPSLRQILLNEAKTQAGKSKTPSARGFADSDILGKIGIGSAGALGAAGAYNKLADKYGTESYTAAPTLPTTPTTPVIKSPSDIAAEIAKAETRGEKTPYSFSQWSNKNLGPGSPLGKALGKYQITEARLSEKAQAFLGQKVTPHEFLSSPALQDKFIQAQVAWQQAQGLNEDQILATHRYGWGHMDPKEIAMAVEKAQPYIKSARN